MKIPPNVVDELIKGTNSDIRQVLNMLSTFKLGKSEMDFDEGKHLCVAPIPVLVFIYVNPPRTVSWRGESTHSTWHDEYS